MKFTFLIFLFAFGISTYAQNDPGMQSSKGTANEEVTGTIAKPSKKSNKEMKDLSKEIKKSKSKKKKKPTKKPPEEN